MVDKKPPFGNQPLMGMPPQEGGKPPFDGPPPEMPEQDVSHIKNKRLALRYGVGHAEKSAPRSWPGVMPYRALNAR